MSGIYSIENNVINRLKEGTLKIIKKKNCFFSRIHVEDIAKILTISLKKISPGQIFNISDNYPCPNQKIAKYAASLVKVTMSKEINAKDIKSKMLAEEKQKNGAKNIRFSNKSMVPLNTYIFTLANDIVSRDLPGMKVSSFRNYIQNISKSMAGVIKERLYW